MPCVVQSLGSTVDVGDVLRLVGFLELTESVLDGTLLVSGDLVAILLEVLLALEDEGIGTVDLVYLLASLALASSRILLISSSLSPEEASIRIFCSLPVALSFADTFRIPLASISKVTSI